MKTDKEKSDMVDAILDSFSKHEFTCMEIFGVIGVVNFRVSSTLIRDSINEEKGEKIVIK